MLSKEATALNKLAEALKDASAAYVKEVCKFSSDKDEDLVELAQQTASATYVILAEGMIFSTLRKKFEEGVEIKK